MKITSIHVSNLLSIEDMELSFDDSGLVLVEGWNHDSDRSNGAGKSAIFNCISYAIYDRLPRKVTASEILRRGSKQGSVTVKFNHNQDCWSVTRSRPKNVKFYKNEIEQTITQEEFEHLIQLSYDQFLLTIYNAQNASDRFLLCSDSDKKNFLVKLLNLDQFEIYKKASDLKYKTILSNLDQTVNNKNITLSKIEVYSESLIDETDVKDQISYLELQNLKHNEEIISLSIVERPNLDKYSTIEEDIKSKLSDISGYKTKRYMLYSSYEQLKISMNNHTVGVPCRECGSILATDNEYLNKLSQKILKIKNEIDEIDTYIGKEQELLSLNKKLIDKKKQESIEYEKATSSINQYRSIINLNANKLETLKLKLDKNSQFVNKINNLKQSIIDTDKNIDEYKRELEFYKTISNFYSSTGAQAYVFDSIIDYFNESVKKYIEVIWPNASYELLSYKENSKGENIAKFSENLTMDGKRISVGSLSGGEFKALSLCVDFSLMEVLNKQFNIDINPIILDEPFDGLDNIGKELALTLLENIARDRQILVVDHASEFKAMFSKIISIHKKNGISKLNTDM